MACDYIYTLEAEREEKENWWGISMAEELEYSRDSITKTLSTDHWSYIQQLLDVTISAAQTFSKKDVLKMIEFHYVSAFVHGYKHAKELEAKI